MSSSEPPRQRRRVVYRGRVQGVGFRATTAAIARRFPVVGYVRNRADGTVELVAEAAAASLDPFLSAVESHFEGYISSVESEDTEVDEEFAEFRIRF